MKTVPLLSIKHSLPPGIRLMTVSKTQPVAVK
jgi:hypothetical protein